MRIARTILIVVASGLPSAAFAAQDPGPAQGAVAQKSRAEPDRRADPVLVSTTGDEGCSRVRRKLWVEGDGWIVRRVSLCRY